MLLTNKMVALDKMRIASKLIAWAEVVSIVSIGEVWIERFTWGGLKPIKYLIVTDVQEPGVKPWFRIKFKCSSHRHAFIEDAITDGITSYMLSRFDDCLIYRLDMTPMMVIDQAIKKWAEQF